MTRKAGGIAVVLLLVAASAQAEIRAAELRVNGLTCPFCAFGIEKKLRAVSGVEEVQVFLDEGRIELRFADGNRAEARDIDAAVEKAGFRLAGMRAEVRGTVSRDSTPLLLEAGGGVRFRLVADNGTRGDVQAASGEVVVRGSVRDPGSALPALRVDSLEP
ncbi:MAG: heavy-metal-associated domain-containing protein [Myxococcota bacterium]